jgi:hypothetical protein
MYLKLTRNIYSDKSTIGELEVDGKFQCYTLEDVTRVFKITKKTAIPEGCYDIALTYSPRFGKTMPLVESVKGFEGIRIHTGNSADDTEGCILVGEKYKADWISNSRDAYAELYEKLIGAASLGEHITIEILDTKPARLI